MTNEIMFHNIKSILDNLRDKDPLKFKELFDEYELVRSYNGLLSLRIHRDSMLPQFTVMFDYNTILQSRVRIHITPYHATNISDFANMFTKYKMYFDEDLSIKSVKSDIGSKYGTKGIEKYGHDNYFTKVIDILKEAKLITEDLKLNYVLPRN